MAADTLLYTGIPTDGCELFEGDMHKRGKDEVQPMQDGAILLKQVPKTVSPFSIVFASTLLI